MITRIIMWDNWWDMGVQGAGPAGVEIPSRNHSFCNFFWTMGLLICESRKQRQSFTDMNDRRKASCFSRH